MISVHIRSLTKAWSPRYVLNEVLPHSVASILMLLPVTVQAQPILHGQFRGHELTGESIAQVTCSSSSMRFATVTSDGSAKVWNADGTLLRRYQPALPAMLFNGRFEGPEDSGFVVAAYNGFTSLWSTSDEAPRSLGPNLSGTTDTQPLFDHGALVTSSDDGSIRYWSLEGTLLKRIERPGVSRHLAYSHPLQLIAATQDIGTVTFLSPDGSQLNILKTDQGRLNDVVFSPSKPLMFTGGFDGTVKVWDLSQGVRGVTLLRTIPAPAGAGWLEGLAVNTNGVIASAYDDGILRFWNLKGDNLGQISLASGLHLFSVCFAPDQQTVRTITQDGTVSTVVFKATGH